MSGAEPSILPTDEAPAAPPQPGASLPGDGCSTCVAHLRLIRPQDPGLPALIHLRDGVPLVIGRERASTDVVFDSQLHPRLMSRVHATLSAVVSGGQLSLSVIDHNSLNGVFVNGVRILNRKLLADGHLVTFGCGDVSPRVSGFVYVVETPQPPAQPIPRPAVQQIAGQPLIAVPPAVAPGGPAAVPANGAVDLRSVGEAPERSVRRRQREEEDDGARAVRPRLATGGDAATPDGGASRPAATGTPEVLSGAPGGLPTSDAPFVQPVAQGFEDEFTCVVCQELMLKAVTLTCSHSFCGSCVDTWLSLGNKECPMCRVPVMSKAPSRVIDNAVQRILQSQSAEERSKFEERLKDLEASEAEALRQLRDLAENAKQKNKAFLNVAHTWTQKDRLVFAKGVRRYRGEARRFWCELTHLTPSFVMNQPQSVLVQAVRNVGVHTSSLSLPDLQSALLNFINGTGVAAPFGV